MAVGGVVEADGVRWPRSVRLTLDGKPYFALEIRTPRVMERLDEPLLAGAEVSLAGILD